MSEEIKQQEKKYGLVREIWPSKTSDKNIKNMKEETRKKYMSGLKDDTRQVKARFRNFEPKGADHTMFYKKHGCESLQMWRFKDKETYVVPFGLVDYVNNTCRRTMNTLVNGKEEAIYEQMQEFTSLSFS